jgi:hypothetical protein
MCKLSRFFFRHFHHPSNSPGVKVCKKIDKRNLILISKKIWGEEKMVGLSSFSFFLESFEFFSAAAQKVFCFTFQKHFSSLHLFRRLRLRLIHSSFHPSVHPSVFFSFAQTHLTFKFDGATNLMSI